MLGVRNVAGPAAGEWVARLDIGSSAGYKCSKRLRTRRTIVYVITRPVGIEPTRHSFKIEIVNLLWRTGGWANRRRHARLSGKPRRGRGISIP